MKKNLLTAIIIVFTLMTAFTAIGAIFLLKFRDSRVEETLLEMGSDGGAEFYCFDFSERFGDIGRASLIEGARLDNGVKYKYVSFPNIPADLLNAFVAIEDKRFYMHSGVDYLRTGRAALNYVFGNGSFGGSTITQQLVKNLTARDDFSVERKLSEAFSAFDIEKKYDKTEILEMYLNVINLSEGCRGVGAAAELFYSKEPSELTLSECATIAAITNNPAVYNPMRHPENNIKRRNTVLKCMLEQGFVTEDAYLKAVEEPISLCINESLRRVSVNSWYIDMVVEDVICDICEKYGVSRGAANLMLYRGGYKIYTAMDRDIQRILESYYADESNFPIGDDGEIPQSSMIIIDPYSGDILGVAGAVGEKKANRIQNYATQIKRPPGSAIKPISVYAPALDKGIISWSTVISDAPINEGSGETPWPSNVTKTYVGDVDIKYALENSLNTVAVKVLKMLGENESFDFLKNRLHIESLDENSDMGAASLALGQPAWGVTLREVTAAYSIFEEGVYSAPRSYYLVTDSGGSVILGNPISQEEVITRESAAIMTKLLESVVDSGTAAGKISLDKSISVAGKSGTSQSNCDRYFVGYTPELLGGVWFGYDYPRDLAEFGGNLSVYIWDEVMSKIHESTDYGERKTFKIPETVQRLSYTLRDGSSDVENKDQTFEGWFQIEPHK